MTSSMTKRKPLSRRTMLRGLGTAMALPVLDAMAPSSAAALSAQAEVPRRMGFMFVPNGVHLPNWTPMTEGYGFELPRILAPLNGVKDDLLVLTGLTHDKGRANGDGGGDHARAASVFLTGAQPIKTHGANIRVGKSVDQIAADAVGQATRFASLELGCESSRTAGNCDSGYSCAYSSAISWKSPVTPMAKEINPRAVFDRIFTAGDASDQEQAKQRMYRKSILDLVMSDAKRLHQRVGKADQQKLDEYLTGVRSIEQRIMHSGPGVPSQYDYPEVTRPNGIPRDYADHIKLMGDMMVLAFQTDSTRISTFMLANAGSNRNYRQIDVPDGHHSLSHHGNNPEKLEKITKINHFHVTQVAYILERMKSIREGDGSLLDNCMIMYGSGLSDGNRHNNENLPIILAGGGGGTIRTGRHVRYAEETPMCNLFHSMLQRMNVNVDHIGDSTGTLPYLG